MRFERCRRAKLVKRPDLALGQRQPSASPSKLRSLPPLTPARRTSMTASRNRSRARISRDEFPARVKRMLAERVAYRCSSPSCRVQTIGPSAEAGRSAHHGEAAHISGASTAGPRGDAAMTPEQRSSIENGIWLCRSCARIIDADRLRFSVALLQEWKAEAERLALEERGRRVPHSEDATNLLTTALGGQAARLSPNAIANVHSAAERALAALDPRLSVRTSYSGGATTLRIGALEPVPIRFAVPSDSNLAWRRGLQAALAFGTPARLPATGISATGSPLIEALISPADLEGAVLEILPLALPAVVRMIFSETPLPSDGSTAAAPFQADFTGNFSAGSDGFTFVGQAFGGLVSLFFRRAWRRDCLEGDACAIGWHFARWTGTDIRRLPYFDATRELTSSLSGGTSVLIQLLIEGRAVGTVSATPPTDSSGVATVMALAHHISNVQALAREANSACPLHLPDVFPSNELLDAELEARLLRGPVILAASELRGRLRAIYASAPQLVNFVDQTPMGLVAEFVESGREITLSGRTIPLQDRRVRIFNARAIESRHPLPPERDGSSPSHQAVEFLFEPLDGFRCELELSTSN